MAVDSNETSGDYSDELDDSSPDVEPNEAQGEEPAGDTPEPEEGSVEALAAALLAAQEAEAAAKDQALRAMAEGETSSAGPPKTWKTPTNLPWISLLRTCCPLSIAWIKRWMPRRA